jgi:hypothetical protein
MRDLFLQVDITYISYINFLCVNTRTRYRVLLLFSDVLPLPYLP